MQGSSYPSNNILDEQVHKSYSFIENEQSDSRINLLGYR